MDIYTININLYIIFSKYTNKTKDNGLKLQREEGEDTLNKTLRTQTMPMTAPLAKTPIQAETLLYSLEWAATGIGPHVNAHKMEYMSFNQRGDIFT